MVEKRVTALEKEEKKRAVVVGLVRDGWRGTAVNGERSRLDETFSRADKRPEPVDRLP